MSIKLRLALLLGFLLLGFLAALLVLREIERRGLEQMAAGERNARALLLGHWIDLADGALPQFTADVAQSELFAQSIARADTTENRAKIEASLASSGMSMLWVIASDGTPRYRFSAPGRRALPALPIDPQDFSKLVAETPSPRFFALADADLLEICVRRLQPSGNASADWLAVVRTWDDAQLRTVATLTESNVSLVGAHEISHAPTADSQIVLLRTLADWQGHPLRTLRVEYRAPELEYIVQGDWRQAQVFFAFGLLLIVAVGLALQRWVLSPLGKIGESLARSDPQLVRSISTHKSELGRIAQRVMVSFAQQNALQREFEERTRAQQTIERSEATLRRTLEERAQLGRDLHDGVIQSLYAAGMSLVGVRTLLRPDQVQALAQLEQTRGTLNETILDVRNFINGLEPEALKLQTFTHAVEALFATMQGIRPFRSTVHIDEELAMRLTLVQRAQALQIARESVSNALRHGLANEISVALRTAGDRVEFQIIDDGAGFDATEQAGSGLGLKNLALRARELGGELIVDSKPDQGTRVKLSFSFKTHE